MGQFYFEEIRPIVAIFAQQPIFILEKDTFLPFY